MPSTRAIFGVNAGLELLRSNIRARVLNLAGRRRCGGCSCGLLENSLPGLSDCPTPLLPVNAEGPSAREGHPLAARAQPFGRERRLLAKGSIPLAALGVAGLAWPGEVGNAAGAVGAAARAEYERLVGAAVDGELRSVQVVGGVGLQRRRQAAGASAGDGPTVRAELRAAREAGPAPAGTSEEVPVLFLLLACNATTGPR